VAERNRDREGKNILQHAWYLEVSADSLKCTTVSQQHGEGCKEQALCDDFSSQSVQTELHMLPQRNRLAYDPLRLYCVEGK